MTRRGTTNDRQAHGAASRSWLPLAGMLPLPCDPCEDGRAGRNAVRHCVVSVRDSALTFKPVSMRTDAYRPLQRGCPSCSAWQIMWSTSTCSSSPAVRLNRKCSWLACQQRQPCAQVQSSDLQTVHVAAAAAAAAANIVCLQYCTHTAQTSRLAGSQRLLNPIPCFCVGESPSGNLVGFCTALVYT